MPGTLEAPTTSRGRTEFEADPARGGVADRVAIRSAALLLVGGAVASVVGGARLVEYALPIGAVLVAGWLLGKARYAGYLEFTLWLWLVTPGLRRVVDLHTHYHSVSLVLLTAPLVSLLSLLTASRWRRAVDRHVAVLVVVTAVVLGFGVIVGATQGSSSALAAGIADWVAPFVLGAAVLLLPCHDGDLRGVLRRVARAGLIVLGGYALIQWVFAPAWDVAWLSNVSGLANSFGQPHPYEIRVFSLLNSPGPFATVIGWLLVVHAGLPRWRWGWLATSLGLLGLALSEVRSAWLVTAIALVLLAWRGRARIGRGVLLLAGIAIVVAAIGGPLLTSVQDRAQTITSGSSDESFSARFSYQKAVLPALLRDPAGAGIGSTGAGARQNAGSDAEFSNTDSGYVSLIRTFGSGPGLLAAVLMVVVAFSVFARTRWRDAGLVAVAALSATIPIAMLFGNDLTSVSGLVAWLGLAMCGRWLVTGRPAARPR